MKNKMTERTPRTPQPSFHYSPQNNEEIVSLMHNLLCIQDTSIDQEETSRMDQMVFPLKVSNLYLPRFCTTIYYITD